MLAVTSRFGVGAILLCGSIALFVVGSLIAVARSQEPAAGQPSGSSAKPEEAAAKVVKVVKVSEREARRQAEILHEAIHSTLQLVHHQFYREDEGLPLPAAVLSEVFADVAKEQNVQLRWLAVEGEAMNADHKPQGAFENQAVKALKSGQRHFEQSEGDVYRRAGAIRLSNHCLKCHVPDRKSLHDRTAGLIISIPISQP